MMAIIYQIENIRKKIEIINKKQMKILELKSTKTEVNKYKEGSTADLSWQKIELVNLDVSIQMTQSEEEKEKRMNSEQNFEEL